MSLFTLKAKTTLNYYKLAEGENNKGTEFSDFIFHESYIIIMDLWDQCVSVIRELVGLE